MLTALMRGSSRWPVPSGSAGMMIPWESAGPAGFLRSWTWVLGVATALGGVDPPLTHRRVLRELEVCLHASSPVQAAMRPASCRQVLEAHQAGPRNRSAAIVTVLVVVTHTVIHGQKEQAFSERHGSRTQRLPGSDMNHVSGRHTCSDPPAARLPPPSGAKLL